MKMYKMICYCYFILLFVFYRLKKTFEKFKDRVIIDIKPFNKITILNIYLISF